MLTFLLVLSLTLGGVAPVAQAKKKVVRYSDPIVLYVGQSHKIRNNGNKKKARWVSGKKSVVTVTRKGKLTAKKVGKTTVTMKIRRFPDCFCDKEREGYGEKSGKSPCDSDDESQRIPVYDCRLCAG